MQGWCSLPLAEGTTGTLDTTCVEPVRKREASTGISGAVSENQRYKQCYNATVDLYCGMGALFLREMLRETVNL